MGAATWTTAGAEVVVVLLAIMATWARTSARIARLEVQLAMTQDALRRIEDAVWAQAGIAVLRPAQHPHGQS